MGASLKEIGIQVSNGFVWVIVIACIIGAPLAFFVSKSIIQSLYSYHIPLNSIPFLLTATILILAVSVTVSSQIIKAVGVNPAKQLRDE